MRGARPRMDFALRLSPTLGLEARARVRTDTAALGATPPGRVTSARAFAVTMVEITARALLVACAVVGAHAWGGLFNRFSPEMLNNLAYSGHERYRPLYPYHHAPEESYSALESAGNRLEEAVEEAADCYNSPCWDNEACCPGLVCYNPNGEEFGRCLPGSLGRKLGELCSRDTQCDAGLLCEDVIPGEPRVCRPPTAGHKQYNQECNLSSECDITRGLCCTIQRRHRQKPRKSCAYFKDPLICIGPVATDQIHSQVEHTAGEKRIGFFKRLP